MAATMTRGAMETARPYPTVNNETLELLRQQQQELLRNGGERVEPPAELNRPERFIFRSQPRTFRRIVHQLDLPPEVEENDDTVVGRQKRFLLRTWQRRHKADPTGDAERLGYVAEQVGGSVIAFREVARKWECWFATDDEQVAGYLRGLVTNKVGEFAHVYEQNGTARVVVGDTAFPNTEMGWRAAREHAQLIGVTDIKIVAE